MRMNHFAHWPPGLTRTLTVPRTSVFDNLEVSARRYPDKTAIHYYGKDLTYRQVLAEVNELAGFLQKRLGVAKGDRVILYMQNAPQFLISYYAVMRIGAVVVPLNPMLVAEELSFYVQDSGASVALTGQELFSQIAPSIGTTALRHVIVAAYSEYASPEYDLDVPDVVKAPRQSIAHPAVVLWDDALSAGLWPEPVEVGADDMAVIPYTSGTTGKPKGCIHTHSSVQANLVGAACWGNLTSDTVTLAILPWFHVTGMEHGMNAAIYCGATIVAMTRWNRDTAAELIQRHGCTHWVNISTMVVDFLANPRLSEYKLDSLLFVGGGGASLPRAVGEKLQALTGLVYTEGYGLSETMAQSHFNPPNRPKLQCLGIPSFGVEALVVDPETLAEKGPGEEGELLVRGPQVFQGYWNRPEETAEAFVTIDGKRFFRTGDIVTYDEEGYYFIVDRLKRMINAAGFKVWPTEVESVLYKHPDIRQACVVGVPDERRGETVKAYVVLHEQARGRVREEEIIEWAKEHMAAYKVPRIVQFVEALPVSATGKILWKQLQDEERARAGQR